MVDINRRSKIIETHYDDVDSDEEAFIAKGLRRFLEEGMRKGEVRLTIVDETGLDRERVVEIVRTERASIQKEEAVRKFPEIPSVVGLELLGAEECHPICETVQGQIQQRGGAVNPNELQKIYRDVAAQYEDGTPKRMNHWSPHHECKVTVRSVM
jgi:hypothetical protein